MRAPAPQYDGLTRQPEPTTLPREPSEVSESAPPIWVDSAEAELRTRLMEQIRDLEGRLQGANGTAREAISQLRAALEREATLRAERARLTAQSEERERLLLEVTFLREQLQQSRRAEEQLRTFMLRQSEQLASLLTTDQQPAMSAQDPGLPPLPDAPSDATPAREQPWWRVSERPPVAVKPWWKR
jgi:hypothetical protein